jgi:hypothetical protein
VSDPRAEEEQHGGRDREFVTAVEDGAAELSRFLREQMIRRPYGTMGGGALLGYALGGGLTIRTSALLLRAAARVAMVRAVQELMPVLPAGRAVAPSSIFGRFAT